MPPAAEILDVTGGPWARGTSVPGSQLLSSGLEPCRGLRHRTPPGALPTPAWAHLREGLGPPTPGSLVGPMLIFYLFESGTGSGFKVSLK